MFRAPISTLSATMIHLYGIHALSPLPLILPVISGKFVVPLRYSAVTPSAAALHNNITYYVIFLPTHTTIRGSPNSSQHPQTLFLQNLQQNPPKMTAALSCLPAPRCEEPKRISMAFDDYIAFTGSPPRTMSRLLDIAHMQRPIERFERFSGQVIADIWEGPRLSDCYNVFDASLGSLRVQEALAEECKIGRKRRAVGALLRGRGLSKLLWR